jgi:hypothetical protein
VMSTSGSSIPAEISFFNSENKTWLIYNSTCLHHDQDCSVCCLFYMLMTTDKKITHMNGSWAALLSGVWNWHWETKYSDTDNISLRSISKFSRLW